MCIVCIVYIYFSGGVPQGLYTWPIKDETSEYDVNHERKEIT
jgi:hypothetical protein